MAPERLLCTRCDSAVETAAMDAMGYLYCFFGRGKKREKTTFSKSTTIEASRAKSEGKKCFVFSSVSLQFFFLSSFSSILLLFSLSSLSQQKTSRCLSRCVERVTESLPRQPPKQRRSERRSGSEARETKIMASVVSWPLLSFLFFATRCQSCLSLKPRCDSLDVRSSYLSRDRCFVLDKR